MMTPVSVPATSAAGVGPGPTAELSCGKPRFADAGAATLANAGETGAAWRSLIRDGDIGAAAAATGGDFAVGLHDADGRTLLAVDRFAMQTLCWKQDGDRLLFAERADTLAGTDAEIDPQAIFDYLFFHAIPSPRTIFKGVQRLPPAHVLRFENGRAAIERYWLPRFEESAKADFDALRDEFRGLLESAVAAQLDGGKPACFLSGGTDSSTIAGMIGRAAGRAASTYSIGFDADGYDEMSFARVAARHFGTEHHEYYVTPDDLVRSMADVAASYDQPFGNSSALPAYYCARMARADGVTRILAGDGGDELFGGNTRYAKQRVFDAYGQVPAPLRKLLVDWWATDARLSRLPLLGKASSYVQQARVALPDRLNLYNLIERLSIERVFEAGFLHAVDTAEPLRQQRAAWDAAVTDSAVNRHLAFDWRFTLAESDLPKVRGTAALAGLAVGFPMLDAALVDFSLRLPVPYKLRGQALRWFFKEALHGFLPDAILQKKKQGFGLPFGVWACRSPALLALAGDALRSLAGRGIVQGAFIDRLLIEHLPSHPGYYGEMVWILTVLELWLQAHAPSCRFA